MSDNGVKIIATLEIGKLQLRPGDVLVVKTDRPMSKDATDKTRKHLAGLLPQGVTTLFIDRGVDLSVLTQAEIEERIS